MIKTKVNELTQGAKIYDLMVKLFPICRSITGNGVRQTLKIIRDFTPLEIFEVPTGTRVFDWTIPKEWNIKDAYIIDPQGKKILDFKRSNLIVLNYSIPVKRKISLAELKKHIWTLPDQPVVIPYYTSYYKEEWGFCMPHQQLLGLIEGEYEICIESTLEPGNLTYGEYVKKGETDQEILVSCYICHPSLCNDNLSGAVITVFLAKHLSQLKTKYTYRFLFIPETIGALTWLSRNQAKVKNIKHGLVATCLGDPGPFTYKKSRQNDAGIDRAVIRVLETSGVPHGILGFFPSGSDERQFCSPGFDLPVGSLMRTKYGKFKEYHTSADDLEFVSPNCLAESYNMYLRVFEYLEKQRIFINVQPWGEPQLGKRGLYRMIGGHKTEEGLKQAFLWVLNFSDGAHSLEDIFHRANNYGEKDVNISLELIEKAAEELLNAGLIKKV